MSSVTTHDLQRVLSFPLKDPKWKEKLLITTALGLGNFIVPILPSIFLAGYYSGMIRQIIARDGEPSLPEWTDWGRYLSDGIKYAGAGLIYSLPMILFMGLGYLMGMIPAFLTPMLDTGHSDFTSTFTLVGFICIGGEFFFIAIGMIFSLIMAVFSPAALTHVAASNEFSAAFRFAEWWKIFRANLGGYLVALIVFFGSYMLIMMVSQIFYMTVVLCCIVPIVMFIATSYLGWVWIALWTQAYLQGVKNLESQAVA